MLFLIISWYYHYFHYFIYVSLSVMCYFYLYCLPIIRLLLWLLSNSIIYLFIYFVTLLVFVFVYFLSSCYMVLIYIRFPYWSSPHAWSSIINNSHFYCCYHISNFVKSCQLIYCFNLICYWELDFDVVLSAFMFCKIKWFRSEI